MDRKTLHRIGAAILVVVAVILMLLGSPPKLAPLRAAEEIGAVVGNNEDKLSPMALAEWIIGETGDYQIIDIRDPRDFADFHIEGSVNIPLALLLSQEGISQLPNYKKIVLVFADGARAGQAWTVLRSRGFEAYILDGGIKGWWDKVMTPASVQTAESESETEGYAAKIRAMRELFSGTGGQLSTPSAPVETQAPPQPTQTQPKAEKKMGGC